MPGTEHEGAMASVMIVCPDTRREIYTGIDTDEASFAKLPKVPALTRCPICGKDHVWSRDEAWLSAARKQVA
jgi:hypothetical protein